MHGIIRKLWALRRIASSTDEPENIMGHNLTLRLPPKDDHLNENSTHPQNLLRKVQAMMIDRTQIEKVDMVSKKTGQRYSTYQDIRKHCNIQNFNVRYEEIRPYSKACAPHKHTELEEFYLSRPFRGYIYSSQTKCFRNLQKSYSSRHGGRVKKPR